MVQVGPRKDYDNEGGICQVRSFSRKGAIVSHTDLDQTLHKQVNSGKGNEKTEVNS